MWSAASDTLEVKNSTRSLPLRNNITALKMTRIFILLTCLTLALAGRQEKNEKNEETEHKDLLSKGESIINSFGKGISKEVAAAKHPVETSVTYIGSSQCSKVKKLIGVAYEQVEGEKEPDLNQLALQFRDSAVKVIYNITTAAELIPQARGFNPHQKLYIFVHGFTDEPQHSSFGNISEALMAKGKYNVLALDASSLIHWMYLRSTTYVRFIGEKLGEVLASMVHSGANPAAIHIMGHSLGSHISGFAGKTFTKLTGMRIGRISGLDPAGPCFSHIDPELRLKASDADFVDVIHTDGGVYGLTDAIGHVDFYPNSGSEQPNCFSQSCSHRRVWQYYSESVMDPEAFPAKKCKDWEAFKKGQCENDISYMGFSTDPKTRGLYYLQTAEEEPFGLGIKGLTYNNNEAIVKKVGSKLFG